MISTNELSKLYTILPSRSKENLSIVVEMFWLDRWAVVDQGFHRGEGC